MTSVARRRADAEALGGDYYPPCWLDVSSQVPGRSYGIGDLHAHLMGHLAFGGHAIWGEPEGPPHTALRSCAAAHGRFGLRVPGILDGWRRHGGGGYPDFHAWPTFDGLSHQQMYLDWIRRAHQGGLRLMVALVVNNELLAWALGGRRISEDVNAISIQMAWLKAFAARHPDLLEIAYSPADARRIIAADRLALIIGVEIDSLVECAPDGQSRSAVERWLEHLHAAGVRHVFPVHLVDNAVGGAALYHPLFDVLNRWLRGRPFEARIDEGIEFEVGRRLLWRMLAGRPFRSAAVAPGHGHVNVRGLSPLGRSVVLPALMRLGMVIDIDHMSAAAAAETLTLAERRGYPLVAGHAAFRDLALDRRSTADLLKVRNEYQRARDDVVRIARLGGIVGVGWVQRDLRAHCDSLCHVPNDASGSAKSWAQAYLYAVEHAGGAPVALGSDTHGIVGAPGPRFGPRAASGLDGDRLRSHLRAAQVATQREGVRYHRQDGPNIPTRDHRPLTMSRIGTRAFDINVDGVAHYGMLPDFLQDLRNVGVAPGQLTPLFSSADGYISAWERACKAR